VRSGFAVAVSRKAPVPHAYPILVKVPPRYALLPLTTTLFTWPSNGESNQGWFVCDCAAAKTTQQRKASIHSTLLGILVESFLAGNGLVRRTELNRILGT
jgi:hypothetical protein